MRVSSGYHTAHRAENGMPAPYLTYGYDEFGNDLYKDMEEAGIPNPYSRQGEEQPFGYTGYRHDDISGTYFAQAREYQPENGRFTAEDVIKGNGAFPETLNRYGYCLGNPIIYIDRTGLVAYIIYDDTNKNSKNKETNNKDNALSEYAIEVEKVRLEKLYGEAPIMCPVTSIEDFGEYSFAEVWMNQIGYDEEGNPLEVEIEEFIMNAQIKRKFMLIILIIMLVLCILTVMKPQVHEPREELIDTSIMGEEAPVKIITLNSYMTSNVNYEVAYLLGDKGNLYVLIYDTEKYYVELWHPEFWKDIEVVDICAERPWLYASALDKEGNVYIWKKEYLLGEGETEEEIEAKTNKRENWRIQQLKNIPKVTKIFATHDQFAIVTDEENVCIWYPKENDNPDMDDMEIIDMETLMLNIAAAGDEVFILDENHVLWSMENGTKTFLRENVKSIMQGYKGIAIQLMDNENEVYIYNIRLLQNGYETVAFADKYEVAKIVFEDKISSISVNKTVAIVCTDKKEFYRWGKRKNLQYLYTTVPAESVYAEPVKIDLEDVKYYMIIGENIVYVDNQNRMFVLIPY